MSGQSRDYFTHSLTFAAVEPKSEPSQRGFESADTPFLEALQCSVVGFLTQSLSEADALAAIRHLDDTMHPGAVANMPEPAFAAR